MRRVGLGRSSNAVREKDIATIRAPREISTPQPGNAARLA